MADVIQLRRDTAANWAAVDPILADGEKGIETDTSKEKNGNGVDVWSALPYAGGGSGTVTDVVAGDSISVDVTDPAKPEVKVDIDASTFVGNLSTTDDTVQKVVDKVDTLTTGNLVKSDTDMGGYAFLNQTFAVTTTGSTLDLAVSDALVLNMTGAATLSFTNYPDGTTNSPIAGVGTGSSWIVHVSGGDAHTLTYPANVQFEGANTAPTLKKETLLSFHTFDSGTTVYCKVVWGQD